MDGFCHVVVCCCVEAQVSDGLSFLCGFYSVSIVADIYGGCPPVFVTVDGHDRGFLHVYFDDTPVLESSDGVHEVMNLGVCLGEDGEVVHMRGG